MALFCGVTQGSYWSGVECNRCSDVEDNPQGLECDAEGTLLQSLPLAEGYWRASTETTVRVHLCLVWYLISQ